MNRRGIFPRPSTRAYPEVKYIDIWLGEKAITQETYNQGAFMRNDSFLHKDLFDNIPVGTARNNRIGSKVHIKKLVIQQSVSTCGFRWNNIEYPINDITYRLMVTDVSPGTSSISDFWSNNTCTDRMLSNINRRKYNVYFDKRYRVFTGYPNYATSTATVSNQVTGAYKYIKATIPVNRTIEFSDDGSVKECDDNYTVCAVANMPNYTVVGTHLPTIACVNSFVRIYFTDN